MAWKLDYRASETVPVEVDGILPERLLGLSLAEVQRLKVAVGNREAALGELFSVSQSGSDGAAAETLEFYGDLSGVHWIGSRMTCGQIRVHGPAGRHVGSEMSGGQIHVSGSVGDWVGAELRGGLIHVRGSAGHLAGAAYRGSRRGMLGGTILIEGDAGDEIGHSMRRGLLAVGGAAGDLIGFNLLAGTILVFGSVGIRHGAGMQRGTLGLLGADQAELLPSFRYACRHRPLAIDLLLGHLQQLGFPVPAALHEGFWDQYNGDLITGGRGEMYLRAKPSL
jgi:formylmethanofuran dehydrogenase subunit C